MGMNLNGVVAFGVYFDYDDGVPEILEDHYSEDWEWILTEDKNCPVYVTWYGHSDYSGRILALKGTVVESDDYSVSPFKIPDVERVKEQQFIQWLQDHGIDKEPEWLIAAYYG